MLDAIAAANNRIPVMLVSCFMCPLHVHAGSGGKKYHRQSEPQKVQKSSPGAMAQDCQGDCVKTESGFVRHDNAVWVHRPCQTNCESILGRRRPVGVQRTV